MVYGYYQEGGRAMSNLILNSLEIRNFRGFQHLTIEHLGRVNLIVGKNNIGKSSLLEAFQLYAYRGLPDIIWNILRVRDERRQSVNRVSRSALKTADLLSSLKYLFYGRKEIKEHLAPISIGPLNSFEETLNVSIGRYAAFADDEGNIRQQLLLPDEYTLVDNSSPRFVIQMGNLKANYPLRIDPPTLSRLEIEEIKCMFISANGLDSEREQGTNAADLWDSVALRPLESEVLKALRIIAPGVEDLSFLGDLTSSRRRIPNVKIKDIDEPIPLRSLGDGMQRILGIILALVNSKDGMLLVDEIENGIHYSVQQELWEVIFQLAHRLNVQVFATTHSWDCIEGFAKAAQEQKQEEGVLIQLGYKKNVINATLFDEDELGIAVRQQIEVR